MNEGIALQAGPEVRDIGWTEDPSKVSTKVLARETISAFRSRISGKAEMCSSEWLAVHCGLGLNISWSQRQAVLYGNQQSKECAGRKECRSVRIKLASSTLSYF